MIDGKSANEIFDSIRQHITSGKLANKGFLAKAPEAVVEKEKEKLAQFEEKMKSLEERLKFLDQL